MPNLMKIVFGACVMAEAAIGLGALSTEACAQGYDKPIPPPLGYAQAQYYNQHPSELEAIMAKRPAPHKTLGALADPPQSAPVVGGIWKAVTTPMPSSGASAPHLMMDGTVLVHAACTGNWYRLTPNATGSYAKGSWSAIASMPDGYVPLYFASQVLVDGRLIMNGGEYNGNCTEKWTNAGAIYDPVSNTWASVTPPSGWTQIGDAQSVVLFNKSYMLADCCTKDEAILDPKTMKWTATGSGKSDVNDEEGWSLLPTGDIVTADAYVFSTCGKNTERYTAATGTWASAGNAPVRMSDCNPSYEVGPEVLRTNGTVVMFSGRADGNPAGTAVYNAATGAYVTGSDIPAFGGANYTGKDAPAALMPNGKILVAVSPGVSGEFPNPTRFFEYALDNTVAKITNSPPGSTSEPSFVYNMLVLPTGQIMLTNNDSDQIYLYSPVGTAKPAWAPAITSAPSQITRGTSQQLTGSQLNGRSEAGAYGDDNQAATDYPLARITIPSTGAVYYCTTTDETSRNIAVNAVTTMTFTCPMTIPTGPASLLVVTNGISSASRSVTIH